MTLKEVRDARPAVEPRAGGPKWLGWFILGLITGIAIVAAGIVKVAINNYQPLSSGAFGLEFAEPIRDQGPRSVYRLPYLHGKSTVLSLDLRNDGRYAVTVTGIGEDDNAMTVNERIFIDELVCTAPGRCMSGGSIYLRSGRWDTRAIPFKPFRLEPGEHRQVAIEQRFVGCEGFPDGVSSGASYLRVRFRSFGVEKETHVRLLADVVAEGVPGSGLPRKGCPVTLGKPARDGSGMIDAQLSAEPTYEIWIRGEPQGGPCRLEVEGTRTGATFVATTELMKDRLRFTSVPASRFRSSDGTRWSGADDPSDILSVDCGELSETFTFVPIAG